jgi:hypothetical protein
MNGHRMALAVLLMGVLGASVAHATDPWPGETWQQSTVLTGLDTDFQQNLSGAFWNEHTRTLWVCTNGPGRFWALVPDGHGSFMVQTAAGRRGEFDAPGDDEDLTQADLDDHTVYVLVEGTDHIRRYDVSTLGAPRLVNEFDFHAYVPAYANSLGSEGITFVPDAALSARGFVDANGQPYTSHYGMGGLMFVAHQNGGGVYVFDLNPANNGVKFVGRYLTSRGESSALGFDRSTNHLYIWHNTGSNYLEVSDLTSAVRADGQRHFTTLREFLGPKGGNLEGIAFTPATSGEHSFFSTDDSNQDGAALMWFHHFDPGLAPPPPAVHTVQVPIAGGNDDVEQRSDGSMYMNSSDIELITDGHPQVVGLRFAGVNVPAGAEIVDAYIQFTVDEATNEATQLAIRGEASGNAAPFATTARNVSGRATTGAQVAWTPEAWAAVDAVGAAQQTPPLNTVVQEIVNRPDYRAGNAMAFVVAGSGRRTARSYEQSAAKAPRLFIEYLDPPAVPVVHTVDARIASSLDDVEQRSNGSMYTNSTDLELVEDGAAQTVGLRFTGLGIPGGATITHAWIQFAVDETSAGGTQVTVRGEAAGNAAAFTTTAYNVSQRHTTFAQVPWAIQPWSVVGEAGAVERTPDLTAVVQEIVGTPGYAAASAMVFVITGAGHRTAVAYDGNAGRAPVLHVEYRQ